MYLIQRKKDGKWWTVNRFWFRGMAEDYVKVTRRKFPLRKYRIKKE